MRKLLMSILLCLILLGAVVQADEIYFKNGDRLSGQIVKMTDGKLVVKTPVAGEVTVNVADIKTFSSATPVQIHLKDGTVLNQNVVAAEAEEFAIETGDSLQAQTFRVGDLASINPPVKPAPQWTGNVSAGISVTRGNTSADIMNASVGASRRGENDRITVGADYAKGRQEDPATGNKVTTEDWWRAKGKYDYFFSKKFYGFLDGRYEKDTIAQLDRRVAVGAGGGYQWIERDDMNFSTEAGVASIYEKFDNQTASNSEMSLQVGYNFDKQLLKNVKFIHDLTYYPAFTEFSDYYLTSTAELRAKFTQNMFANFKIIFNYDASPAVGRGGTDVKYIFGVGLAF